MEPRTKSCPGLFRHLSRRNLTPSQRAIIAAGLPSMTRGRPSKEDSTDDRLSLNTRSRIAMVSRAMQQQADVIWEYGNREMIEDVWKRKATVHDYYHSIEISRKRRQEEAQRERERREIEEARAAQAQRALWEAQEKARLEREAEARARQDARDNEEREREDAMWEEMSAGTPPARPSGRPGKRPASTGNRWRGWRGPGRKPMRPPSGNGSRRR